jgi:hypothetical protein
MSVISQLRSEAKDIVRWLFLGGPRRWDQLPRAGRGQVADMGLLELYGDWAYLNEAGMRVALEEMSLASVKQALKPHERV